MTWHHLMVGSWLDAISQVSFATALNFIVWRLNTVESPQA